MLPCFQLLRIGAGRGGDLYTFHPPARSGCTYRLGCRADLCDVALRPQREPGLISGVHAELHAELQGDDWRVSLEDHSSQGRHLPPPPRGRVCPQNCALLVRLTCSSGLAHSGPRRRRWVSSVKYGGAS